MVEQQSRAQQEPRPERALVRTKKPASHIAVGRPKVRLTASSHVPGVAEGNRPTKVDDAGMHEEGDRWVAEGRRSTGINPAMREPIDPRMPVLTPP